MEEMFCEKCGSRIPDDAKFCVNCGTPVEEEHPSQPNQGISRPDEYVSHPEIIREKNGRFRSGWVFAMLGLAIVLFCVSGWMFCQNKQLEKSVSTELKTETKEMARGLEDEEKVMDESSMGGISMNENSFNENSVEQDSEQEQSATEEMEEQAEVSQPEEGNEDSEEQTELTSYKYSSEIGNLGNSLQNISQSGSILYDGEYIYYIDWLSDNQIRRMKVDTKEQELVIPGVSGFYLNKRDDWLFYRDMNSGYLRRYNVKTKANEDVVTKNVYEPKLVGEYIYYSDATDDSYDLYRTNLDGSVDEKITDGVVFYSVIEGNKIFYLDTRDSRKGYAVDLESGRKWCWRTSGIDTMAYDEKEHKMYFTDYDTKQLYVMDVDTEEISLVSTNPMGCINVYQGAVYYADPHTGALCCTYLDHPTEQVVLVSGVKANMIEAAAGWIHFRDDSDELQDYYMYRLADRKYMKVP